MRRSLALIAAAALLVAGCAGPRAAPDYFMAEPAPYLLDSGDRMRVVVFGQDNLSASFAVDPSGDISMPLIGQVPARGRSTETLAADITARLRNGYVRNPDVSVEIEAYRPFFILGEVAQAGQYPYVSGLTAETAVAVAGGFTPRAVKHSVEITRNIGGEVFRVVVPATTPVRPGDTITVRERWF